MIFFQNLCSIGGLSICCTSEYEILKNTLISLIFLGECNNNSRREIQVPGHPRAEADLPLHRYPYRPVRPDDSPAGRPAHARPLRRLPLHGRVISQRFCALFAIKKVFRNIFECRFFSQLFPNENGTPIQTLMR